MACDIVATPGATNATSYATVSDGDAYFAVGAHLYGAAWIAATEDQKCAALKMATVMLDRWYEWNGTPAAVVQALGWPRAGNATRNGDAQSTTALPADVIAATCEVAKGMIAGDLRADSDVETQQLRQLSVGSISLTFGQGVTAKPIADAVQALLRHWGHLRSLRGTSTPLLRV